MRSKIMANDCFKWANKKDSGLPCNTFTIPKKRLDIINTKGKKKTIIGFM